jgi:hypothetical protein
MFLFVGILTILIALIGLSVMLGIPVGAVWSLVGVVATLSNKDTRNLSIGLSVVTLSLCGVVVAGLLMRWVNVITTSSAMSV